MKGKKNTFLLKFAGIVFVLAMLLSLVGKTVINSRTSKLENQGQLLAEPISIVPKQDEQALINSYPTVSDNDVTVKDDNGVTISGLELDAYTKYSGEETIRRRGAYRKLIDIDGNTIQSQDVKLTIHYNGKNVEGSIKNLCFAVGCKLEEEDGEYSTVANGLNGQIVTRMSSADGTMFVEDGFNHNRSIYKCTDPVNGIVGASDDLELSICGPINTNHDWISHTNTIVFWGTYVGSDLVERPFHKTVEWKLDWDEDVEYEDLRFRSSIPDNKVFHNTTDHTFMVGFNITSDTNQALLDRGQYKISNLKVNGQMPQVVINGKHESSWSFKLKENSTIIRENEDGGSVYFQIDMYRGSYKMIDTYQSSADVILCSVVLIYPDNVVSDTSYTHNYVLNSKVGNLVNPWILRTNQSLYGQNPNIEQSMEFTWDSQTYIAQYGVQYVDCDSRSCPISFSSFDGDILSYNDSIGNLIKMDTLAKYAGYDIDAGYGDICTSTILIGNGIVKKAKVTTDLRDHYFLSKDGSQYPMVTDGGDIYGLYYQIEFQGKIFDIIGSEGTLTIKGYKTGESTKTHVITYDEETNRYSVDGVENSSLSSWNSVKFGDETYDKIEFITSEVQNAGTFAVRGNVRFDNQAIVDAFTITEFEDLEYVHSHSKGSVSLNGSTYTDFPDDYDGPYTLGGLGTTIFASGVLDPIENSILTVRCGPSDNGNQDISYFRNPKIILELPEEIEDVSILSYRMDGHESDFEIKSCVLNTNSIGQKYITFELEGECEQGLFAPKVEVVLDATPNTEKLKNADDSTNVRFMAYSAVQWPAQIIDDADHQHSKYIIFSSGSNEDKYDINENNNFNELVSSRYTDIPTSKPTGIVIRTSISKGDKHAASPEVLELSKQEATGNVTVHNKAILFGNDPFTGMYIVGSIPYVGNKSYTRGADLGSSATTTLNSNITCRNLAAAQYTVYYSEHDLQTLNPDDDGYVNYDRTESMLADTSMGWSTTRTPNAKTYVIKFNTNQFEDGLIPNKTVYEFTYDVTLPNDMDYGDETFTISALATKSQSEGIVTKMVTEDNKTGVRIVPWIIFNYELTKVDATSGDQNKINGYNLVGNDISDVYSRILNGAIYEFSRVDGGSVYDENLNEFSKITVGANNASTFKLYHLYGSVEYKLHEINAPAGYEAKDITFKFTPITPEESGLDDYHIRDVISTDNAVKILTHNGTATGVDEIVGAIEDEPADVNYKVEYYYEQVNGSYQKYATDTVRSAKVASTTTVSVVNDKVMAKDSTTEASSDPTIQANGEEIHTVQNNYVFDSTNTNNKLTDTVNYYTNASNMTTLKVYFKLQKASYTIRYHFQDTTGTDVATKDVEGKYNNSAAIPLGTQIGVNESGNNITTNPTEADSTKVGYKFKNADATITIAEERNYIYNVYFEPDEAQYSVEYYYQKNDGTYGTTPDSTTTGRTAVIGSAVNLTVDSGVVKVTDSGASGVSIHTIAANYVEDTSATGRIMALASVSATPSNNVLKVYFKRNLGSYSVQIFYQKTDGTYGTTPDETVANRPATIGSAVNLTVDAGAVKATDSEETGASIHTVRSNYVEDTGATGRKMSLASVSATASNNVLKVYFKRNLGSYSVQIFYQKTDGTYGTTPDETVANRPAAIGSAVTLNVDSGAVKATDSEATGVNIHTVTANYVEDTGATGRIMSLASVSATASNNILKVYFKRNEVTYTVRYFYQQDDGTYPTTPNSTLQNQGPVNIGSMVTKADINTTPTVSGYSLDEETVHTPQKTDEYIQIVANESNNIFNVYFTKNYKVTYIKGNHGTFNPNTPPSVPYGTNTPRYTSAINPSTQHDVGYVLTGWKDTETGTVYTDVSEIMTLPLTKDKIYEAQWAPRTDISYKVQYYYQNTTNGNYDFDSEIGRMGGVTGQNVSVTDQDRVPTKDNYAYIFIPGTSNETDLVTGEDNIPVLKVYFKYQYTVTYKKGDHGTFDPDIHGSLDRGVLTPACIPNTATEHEPGYKFKGWVEEGTTTVLTDEQVRARAVTSNKTYIAQWEPDEVEYNVYYYYQDDRGNYPTNPTLIATPVRKGMLGTTAQVTNADKTPQLDPTHYSLDAGAPNLFTDVIRGDGSTVLKVYFRKAFTVTYNKGAHGTFADDVHPDITGGSPTPHERVNVATEHEPGYKFTGWLPLVQDIVTGDITYVAQWEPDIVDYHINFYYQVNGTYSTTPDRSELRRGVTNTLAVATATDTTPDPGRDRYVFDSGYNGNVLSQTIAGDGSTLLKVYFKEQFVVTYEPGDHGTFITQVKPPVDYNTDTPEFVGEKTHEPGYEFTGWAPTVADKVTQDATYVAQWRPIDVPYNIEYYYQINGVYPATPEYTVTPQLMSQTGSTATVTVAPDNTQVVKVTDSNRTNYDITHRKEGRYKFDVNAPNELSKVIEGDGSTVLKVYFKPVYTVNYLNGDHGTFDESQEIYPDLSYGDNTPVYDHGATPTGDPGYEFTGWDPVVQHIVTGDATYVAQWRPINVPYKVEFYYEENGSYPATPYATVNRMATTDTEVKLTTPRAVNDLTVLVTDYFDQALRGPEDISRPKYGSNYIYDMSAANIERDDKVNGDGTTVLRVHFKEIPVRYDVDVVLKDTANRTLTNNQFSIDRARTSTSETASLWSRRAVTDSVEIQENKLPIDTYVYSISEDETAGTQYVNILAGKHIEVTANISNIGFVTIPTDGWAIYDENGQVDRADPVYDFVTVRLDNSSDIRKIYVEVVNPVKFTFEVQKLDAASEGLGGTQIEVNSPIVDAQDAVHENEVRKVAQDDVSMSDNGVVEGTTNTSGLVSYEETWVRAGVYTFEVKENVPAGNQYVNILENYKVLVTVRVNANGTLELVKNGSYKYKICNKQTGSEVGESVYNELKNFIDVNIYGNSISTLIDGSGKVNVEITNPVKFNLNINKTDSEGNGINADFVIKKGDNVGSAQEVYSGVVSGYKSITEEKILAGTYTYYIYETQAYGTHANVLEGGKYIKVIVNVSGNGRISIVGQGGNLFGVYNSDNTPVTDYNNILQYIKVEPPVANDGVDNLNIRIENPVKFNVDVTTATTAYAENKQLSEYFLDHTKVIVQRDGYAGNLWDRDAIQGVEIEENPIRSGTYNYYITQDGVKNSKFVNPLDNKYIKVPVNVSAEGLLTIDEANIGVYEGAVGSSQTRYLGGLDSLDDFVKISVNNNADISTLNVLIIDPVTFTVEVKKVDTEQNKNGIANTGIVISSQIVDEQEAKYANEVTKIANNNLLINEDGRITGDTTGNGIISYEEKYVRANTGSAAYRYEIKEIETAGPQYVNMLEGYKIVVNLKVYPDGSIVIIRTNSKNFEIVRDTATEPVTPEMYEYVNVNIDDSGVNAIISGTEKLNVEITNPVRFNMNIIKLDSLGHELDGTSFIVTEDGEEIFSDSVTTGIELASHVVKAGTYTYLIRESQTAGTGYSNILDDNVIKVIVRVSGNGSIELVPQSGKTYSIVDRFGNEVTEGLDKIDPYISIWAEAETTGDLAGVTTIKAQITNPIKYDIDVETVDTVDNFLGNRKVVINKENNYHTKVDITTNVEKHEDPAKAGTYNYYFTQEAEQDNKYINPLDGKFVKATVKALPNGQLEVESVEFFEGAIGATTQRAINGDILGQYVQVWADNTGDVSVLRVKIINPVRFTVALTKLDTEGNGVEDTGISIKSSVINEQEAAHKDESISTAVANGAIEITNAGEVQGTTDGNGKVKYEETWVESNDSDNVSAANSDYYTYEITELTPAGNQYVNVLDGYKVIVRLHVDPNGTLSLVKADGTPYAINDIIKYTIIDENGRPVSENNDAYQYVYIDVDNQNNTLNAIIDGTGSLLVNITNPVRFNFDIIKKDTLGDILYGTKFKVTRNGETRFEGEVTDATEVVEEPINAGDYEYRITETETSRNSRRYVNILKDNRYISIKVRVHGDGTVEYLEQNGKSYRIFESNGTDITDDKDVNEFITLNPPFVRNGVECIDLEIKNPVHYYVDVEAKDTADNFLDSTVVTVQKQTPEMIKSIYSGVAKTNTEVEETPAVAGHYDYYFTQTESKNEKYVNPLANKFVKVRVEVKRDGNLEVESYEFYEGTIGDSRALQIVDTDLINRLKKFVSVRIISDDNGDTLKFTVIDPVRFTFEVQKVQTEKDENGNYLPIANTDFEINSSIIDVQNASYVDENKQGSESKDGIEIAESGDISATTSASGSINYQETWVESNDSANITGDNRNYYTYEITEITPAGNQYSNVFEGYKIVVQVKVNADGTLELKQQNGRNFAIARTTAIEDKSEDLYQYVDVNIDRSGVNAIIRGTEKLNVAVTNPVRFNIDLVKKDSLDGSFLDDAYFTVTRSKLDGTGHITLFDNEVVRDNTIDLDYEVKEDPIGAGEYTYMITENTAPSKKIRNILGNGRYIKMNLKVHGDGEVEFMYQGNKKYTICEANGTPVSDENIEKYISVEPKVIDGVTTIFVEVTNPVHFDTDVETLKTDGTFLDSTSVVLVKEDKVLFTDEATPDVEIHEDPSNAGTYNYYFTQTTKKNEKFVNPLEGIFAKAEVSIDKLGNVTVNNVRYYQGSIGDITASQITDETKVAELNSYVHVTVDSNENGDTLKFTVIDPVRFSVEVKKVDTEDNANGIEDTKITVNSEVVNTQNATHGDEVEASAESKDGINVTENGDVTGTTNESGTVKFEETWVDADVYEYVITEDAAAGKQYVNVLDGYEVVVRVKVDADGNLKLVDASGNEYGASVENKFIIRDAETKQTIPESDVAYKYVSIRIDKDSVSAIIRGTDKLEVEITNPVRYSINLIKKDTTGADITGSVFNTKRYVGEDIILNHIDKEYDDIAVTTDIEIDEDPMEANVYTYTITEKSAPTTRYVNILEDAYIKLKVRVNGNGHIDILDQGSNNFAVFKDNGEEITDRDKVLQFIEVWSEVGTTEDREGVTTINVQVTNPVHYMVDVTTATTAYGEDKNIDEYFLDSTDVLVMRDENDVFSGEAVKEIEALEEPMKAGTYTYYFTQVTSKSEKLINPLEGKYVKVEVTVTPDGNLEIGTPELYRGTINDPRNMEYLAVDEAYNYFKVEIDKTGDMDILKFLVIDPVRFTVELTKLDTEVDDEGNKAPNGIENTEISITSPIINEQNAVHSDEVKETSTSKDGLEINDNGLIEATTNEDGKIKYEETWVDSNESPKLSQENRDFYTYEITEDKTAGNQYVNILDGKKLIVRVRVTPEGDIILVDKDGNAYNSRAPYKYSIVDATTGEELDTSDIAYKYVFVQVDENSVNAIIRKTDKLDIDITNPVRFNLDLIKLDTDGNYLPGTTFTVEKDGRDTALFNGEVRDNSNDKDYEVIEDPIDGGVYTYYIRENETNKTVGDRYVNVLEGKYIKIRARVHGDGKIDILDNHDEFNNDYYEVIDERTGEVITDNDVLRYIKVRTHDDDGDEIYNLDVQVTNPVKYEIDITKLDTLGEFLDGVNVSLYKKTADGDNELYRGNAIREVERIEIPMDAGTYTYYVKENYPKSDRYINVLDGRYIQIDLTVAANGMLSEEHGIYEGDIGKGTLVTEGSVFDYVTVAVDNERLDIVDDETEDVSRLNVTIINPVRFIVEVDKYDTAENPLVGTTFEIDSPIIAEQEYEHDNERIYGIDEDGITTDGTVTGITEDAVEHSPDGTLQRARISYEETWVDATQGEDYYTYYIRETQTSGAQYVNMLDGYQIKLKVRVDAEGNLELIETNGRNYEIVPTGDKEVAEVTEESYTEVFDRYVNITVSNDKILATLNTEVINPVRYKIAVYESIWGDEHIPLRDIPVQIQSEFSGTTTLVTGIDGKNSMEEYAVWAGIYNYKIFQLNEYLGKAVGDEFVNLLDGYYIGIDLNVPGDGQIKTLPGNGDQTTVNYRIFKRLEDGSYEEIVDFNDTIIDDFVQVQVTTDEENVCTLNIYLKTAEKYDFKLIKTDIDTDLNMNDVKFKLLTRASDQWQTDDYELRDAKNEFNVIDTSELTTALVDGLNGVIDIDNILIERCGRYTFELIETTPEFENAVYKDKSESIIVTADIVVSNGKYVLTNMRVEQGERYTIPRNTKLVGSETQSVTVNVANERIKGRYDLVLDKVSKLTGRPLDGAIYKITVEQEGKEEKVLYVDNGNVLSKIPAIPYIGDVDGDITGTATTTIKDIRIDVPETYTIKIEEIKAPETYTKLDDVIELEVTTGIAGEYDDAHFVLKDVKVKDGNHGLVSSTFTVAENEDDPQAINVRIENEYFDLALKQYITSVGGKAITSRKPVINLDDLASGVDTTADYIQEKTPQRAYAKQEVIYTIEVYNEGLIDGYAEEIVDHLPEGLEFVDDEFNRSYGWVYNEANHEVTTNILAKIINKNNKIPAFDANSKRLSSKKIQLKLRVAEGVKVKSKLTTIAEITESLAADRNETIDRDSNDLVAVPIGNALAEYAECQEDDDDFEKLSIEEFDLAPVKYVKSINGQVQNNRIPKASYDPARMSEYRNGIYNGFKYKADNEIAKVKQNDRVVYGINVYNEGTVPSFAKEVRDTIPSGLQFIPDSEVNKKYGWKMLDSNGNVTNDVTKADSIVTSYLADKVINPLSFNASSMVIDCQAVEAEFKIVEPNSSDRCARNIAEVTVYTDDLDMDVVDRDIIEKSGEFKEIVYIKTFDLELEKSIDSIVVTDSGIGRSETYYATAGSEVPKIDVAKNRASSTDIKVYYTIRVRNAGETAGYATEIKDYIPNGLTFDGNENSGWYYSDGCAITNNLSNTLIQPGEYADVKLTLRFNHNAENLGLVSNIAEISNDADENKLDVVDKDSTPNNMASYEDDIDSADFIISIKTGAREHVIAIISGLTMLGVIAYVVRYNRRKDCQ